VSRSVTNEPLPVGPRFIVEYVLFRAVFGLLAILPLRVAMAGAAALAGTVVRLVRPMRRVGLTNLAMAFPEKSAREHLNILVASWQNLGRMVAELAHVHRLDATNIESVVTVDRPDLWKEAEAGLATNGALVLSGHFGNWELAAIAHGLLGHPVHLVVRTIKNPLVDRFINEVRSNGGVSLLRKNQAARGVLRTLRAKGIMVLPLDQNASRRTGVFVDFFGRPASTNAAFARIAQRTGATVYPGFLVREGRSSRHRIVILPPVTFASMADPNQAAVDFTQRCTAVLEEMIRRHPDHWLWTHKRWRTRPLGEPDLY